MPTAREEDQRRRQSSAQGPEFDTLPPGSAGPSQRVRLTAGSLVDHFQIVRCVGRGAMGEVYLARDTRLGRRVALKVIHPALVRSPDVRRRFLEEARTTGQFTHPHIVTVYAVGEARGSPYLAMEYLEGQTLRERLGAERMGVAVAVRSGLAVAEALAEAHSRGILHRDLKPENVLIPRDGRLRVVDFGLALAIPIPDLSPPEGPGPPEGWTPDPRLTTGVSGTPAYMSPEQWLGTPLGAPADVWALGVMLFEMIAGSHPYLGSSIEETTARLTETSPLPRVHDTVEMPVGLSELVARCLERDPSRRPPASEVATQLSRMLAEGQGKRPGEHSPFRGLLPFGESHAGSFFGREVEVSALVERLREQTVIAVVGPSGAGKSSFVHAGVIPRLRESGPWQVLRMRPGRRPFLALAARLLGGEPGEAASGGPAPPGPLTEGGSPRPAGDVERAQRLAQELTQAPGSLSHHLLRVTEERRGRALLVVDQLEELYTQVEEPSVRRAFMQALCALDDPDLPIRVLFTLRDDFLFRLAEGEASREVLSRLFMLRPPEPAALEAILLRPVESAGYTWDDPTLPAEMVAAVSGEAARLPLLQFTAQRLWESRDVTRRRVLRTSYEALGGVGGALAQHADAVLEGISPGERRTARELLMRLVTAEGTRRAQPRAALLGGLGTQAPALVAHLVDARILSVRQGESGDGDGSELELAHESLTVGWARLARWIEESREDLVQLRQVDQAAELWERRGSPPDELWQGQALLTAAAAVERCTLPVPERAAHFLTLSLERHHQGLRRRRRIRLAGAAALSLITALSIVVALVSRGEEHAAVLRWARTELEAARSAAAQGEILEARGRLRGSLEAVDSASGRELVKDLEAERLIWRVRLPAPSTEVQIAPGARRIVTFSRTGTLGVLDATTGVILAFLQGNPGGHLVSDDGRYLLSEGQSGMKLWRLEDGAPVVLEGDTRVTGASMSLDGRFIAAISTRGAVVVWDLEAGGGPRELSPLRAAVSALAFSPDGRHLAAADAAGAVEIWDATSGRREHRLEVLPPDPALLLSFLGDGGSVAAVGESLVARVWDVASGELKRAVQVEDGPRGGLRFEDGGLLSLRLRGAGWRVRDLERGSAEDVPSSFTGLRGLFYGPGGRWGAIYVRDGGLWVEPVAGSEAERRFYPGEVTSLDGRWDEGALAVLGGDGTLSLWDVRRPTPPAEPPALHRAPISSIAFGGGQIASGDTDGDVILWDAVRGTPTARLEAHTSAAYIATVQGLGFSADGQRLVSVPYQNPVQVRDAQTGALLRTFSTSGSNYRAVIAGGGHRIAVALPDERVEVVDVETGASLRLWPSAGPVLSLAIGAGGGLVATTGPEVVHLRDEGSGRSHSVPLTTLHGAGEPRPAISPDEALVSWADGDQIRVWERATSGLRSMSTPGEQVTGVTFSPDGLISASESGVLRLWDLKTETSRIVARHTEPIHAVIGGVGGAVISISHHRELGGSGGGSTDAAPSTSGHMVRHWDLATGRSTLVLRAAQPVISYGVSADGEWLWIGESSPQLRVFSTRTGRPLWSTRAVLGARGEFLTHAGWSQLRPSGGGGAPPRAHWREAAEVGARLAVESADGALLCMATWEDTLEIWDLGRDVRLSAEPLSSVERLVGIPGGCASLVEGHARLHWPTAPSLDLGSRVSALTWSNRGLLLAEAGRLRVIDERGRAAAPIPLPLAEVTALAADGERLLLGTAWGQVLALDEAGRRTLFATPTRASAVTGLAAGPMETVIVGYGSGEAELLDGQGGAVLEEAQLHGPVSALWMVDQRLVVVTQLGEMRTLDLSTFYAPRCEVLRGLWRQAPYVWEEGRAVPRGVEGHPCASAVVGQGAPPAP